MSKVVNNSTYHVQRMRKFPEMPRLATGDRWFFYEVGGLRKKKWLSRGAIPKKIGTNRESREIF